MRAFLQSYHRNKGPMTYSCYYHLLKYMNDIETYINQIQEEMEDRTKYIPVEEAEDWLQRRLMIDIPDLADRLK